MKFISGKKLSMTQMWFGDDVMAVTPVLAGPCTVTQVKSKAKDGYEALQLAYGERKAKNIKKPQLGHYKLADVKPAHVKEFRIEDASGFKIGDVITVETFAAGDKISVTGTSKGRGFQGVVKRYHFHGFRATHGNKDQERMGGSVGPKGPAHVFKGTRMGGRMGGERVTVTNLEVMAIDAAKNIIFVKGAVPGAIDGLIMISGAGELKVNLKKSASVKPEEIKVEEEIKADNEVKEAKEVKEVKIVDNEVKETKIEEVKTKENNTAATAEVKS